MANSEYFLPGEPRDSQQILFEMVYMSGTMTIHELEDK